MSKLSVLSLFIFAATTLAVPQPRAPAAAPSGFDITGVTLSGSGCGSFVSFVSPTTKDASVIFDALFASAGPGVSSSENHKNCVVSFAVTIPSGYNFGLKGLETGAFHQLDSGVSASQTATYSFTSTTATSPPVVVNGPVGPTSATVGHSFTFGSVRSPCGGTAVLKVGLDLLITGASGDGFIAKDSLDLNQGDHYDWVTC
ncbi:hypothetical protein FA13DRAFT_1811747 [Coprinellus micaceus]|uniref:Ubiquitin 3 binding protein But2 C-terminal domain-containing protein n=1 Tax=Coprinellus micaceus TaxID=71717 RepID=A0A4Y7TNX1_COPMI|nr:hypothetical protein FA13DRAFT_1811747 [Coprinellus micaceus]